MCDEANPYMSFFYLLLFYQQQKINIHCFAHSGLWQPLEAQNSFDYTNWKNRHRRIYCSHEYSPINENRAQWLPLPLHQIRTTNICDSRQRILLSISPSPNLLLYFSKIYQTWISSPDSSGINEYKMLDVLFTYRWPWIHAYEQLREWDSKTTTSNCARMESETMKTRQLPRNYMARDSANCSFSFLLFRIYLLSRVHTHTNRISLYEWSWITELSIWCGICQNQSDDKHKLNWIICVHEPDCNLYLSRRVIENSTCLFHHQVVCRAGCH